MHFRLWDKDYVTNHEKVLWEDWTMSVWMKDCVALCLFRDMPAILLVAVPGAWLMDKGFIMISGVTWRSLNSSGP